MRISKHIHSCLLFEHQGEKLLFDPGLFTFLEGKVRPDQFAGVSTIVITHEHPDHLNMKALKEILAKSTATVISNRGVAEKLRPEGSRSQYTRRGRVRPDRSS
jgi:L-ascorbate metabolism protein UlaG (beta-lactamase superfamily)